MLLLLTLVAMLLHVLPQYGSHRDDQYNGERDEKW
jgi:hypothetical protein